MNTDLKKKGAGTEVRKGLNFLLGSPDLTWVRLASLWRPFSAGRTSAASLGLSWPPVMLRSDLNPSQLGGAAKSNSPGFPLPVVVQSKPRPSAGHQIGRWTEP